MPTRRDFLKSAAFAGSSLLLPGCHPPLPKADPFSGAAAPAYAGLTRSLHQEHDYSATVEGTIPGGLRGTLYRNGPGLFDRDGRRKRALIDGDGMIQAFTIRDGGVRYRNRFVRTAKYMEEEKAGRFIYPTWSTQAPGGIFTNFWAGDLVRNQAGITAVIMNGRLFAFDETALPYELDPQTLETLGETSFGLPPEATTYAAHCKRDPATGDWVNFGIRYGPDPEVHLTTFTADLRLRSHRRLPLPRFVYIHDFFITSRHIILLLHPATIEFWGFILGITSLAGSLTWQPEQGNLVLVVERDREKSPVFFETASNFMWHSMNAWEEGHEIVADFIGYANPDHFIGEDPVVFAVMEGRKGQHPSPGQLLRYRIDMNGRRIRQETLHSGNCEWPRINDSFRCRKNRFGYFLQPHREEFFWSIVCRFDLENGRRDSYDFGDGVYCMEAVFAPAPAAQAAEEEGWLLVEGYDSGTDKGFLSVFRGERVADGPVATVHLNHHVPFSFHGHWESLR